MKYNYILNAFREVHTELYNLHYTPQFDGMLSISDVARSYLSKHALETFGILEFPKGSRIDGVQIITAPIPDDALFQLRSVDGKQVITAYEHGYTVLEYGKDPVTKEWSFESE